MDDEPDVRKVVRLHLEKAGYEVMEAEDGEKAIAEIQRGIRKSQQFLLFGERIVREILQDTGPLPRTDLPHLLASPSSDARDSLSLHSGRPAL